MEAAPAAMVQRAHRARLGLLPAPPRTVLHDTMRGSMSDSPDRRRINLMSLSEAAHRLGVTTRTVKRRISEAGLVLPRPGRAVMLTEADLLQLIEATRCRSTSSLRVNARAISSSSHVVALPGSFTRSARTRQTKRLLSDVRKNWKRTSNEPSRRPSAPEES